MHDIKMTNSGKISEVFSITTITTTENTLKVMDMVMDYLRKVPSGDEYILNLTLKEGD